MSDRHHRHAVLAAIKRSSEAAFIANIGDTAVIGWSGAEARIFIQRPRPHGRWRTKTGSGWTAQFFIAEATERSGARTK
jgi:hypothetical protein